MTTGMRIEIKITNHKFLRRLENAPSIVPSLFLAENTHVYAPAILETIKANASGRPGPNIVTGEYQDSIHIVDVTSNAMTFGSDAPQAYRLEYGYVGRDSLGRSYNQPPYAHFRPALWYWQKSWARGLAHAVKQYLRGIQRIQFVGETENAERDRVSPRAN